MSIKTHLRDRIAGRPAYVCVGCGKAYDSDRRNCRACGLDVVSQRGD